MKYDYDVIAIGAGSGGLSVVERAAQYGQRCAVIESKKIGGACVNVGCVPKKVMWFAAHMAEALRDAPDYGFTLNDASLNWRTLVEKRQRYIQMINDWWQGYASNDLGIDVIYGVGRLVDKHRVEVGGDVLTAETIVLSPGAKPKMPDLPGVELGLTSDDFFTLIEQPKQVTVVGSGYIAVELAGILQALGSQVNLVVRKDYVLGGFDDILQTHLAQSMQEQGIVLHRQFVPSSLSQQAHNSQTLTAEDGRRITDQNAVIWAIGREPLLEPLNLASVGLHANTQGFLDVDEQHQTAVPSIYAIGDITGQPQLTPVAIRAGRYLAERLYNHCDDCILDLTVVPTVVFTHPAIGTAGLTEAQAKAQYGVDNIDIFDTTFTAMRYAFTTYSHKTAMKLVVHKGTDKVLGIHIIGDGADEMLQGFAVAMQMGATKADFDRTIAIHPSSAEELVTMR